MATPQKTVLEDTVYVAPERAKRPRGEQPSGCPFCPGNESMTPPTIQQLPDRGDWRSRAFSNRYPITEAHEVVVDTPRHVLTFADLEAEEAESAFRLYRDRTASMEARGLRFLLFRNEGPNAGGSIPHAHAQIVGEADGFPRTRRAAMRSGDARARVVHESDRFVAEVPAVGRFPYELWVRARDRGTAFHGLTEGALADLAGLVLAASRGMRQRTQEKGWNLVLLQGPDAWRLEFLSRTETLAGLELGAEVYVNAVDADASARAWSDWFRR